MMPIIRKNVQQKLLHVPYYTEGPVIDHQGNRYFTSLSGGVIFKIDTEEQLSEWAKATCPNGQLILPSGDHLVCDSKLGALSRFSADGDFLKYDLHGECAGIRIYAPNDLIVDSNGGIYFTDSVRHEGKVGYISANGKQYVVADQLDYPNGLALSKDEKMLFVAESYKNRILVFFLAGHTFEVFADLPQNMTGTPINLPDGIKIDRHDNLWVAHYGMSALQVLNAKGALVDTIDTGIPFTSNLCLTDHEIMVTGGYGEPGPGAVLNIAYPYGL